MNLKRMEEAATAYRPLLDEDDRARLTFFETVWAEQDACQRAFADRLPRYQLPRAKALRECYGAHQPVFLLHPCPVDDDVLAMSAARIAATLREGADYPHEVAVGLGAIDWNDVLASSGVTDPGRDPSEWLIEVEASLGGGDAALGDAEPDATTFVARLGALVASLALKIQLEEPAAQVMKALDGGAADPHPMLCPVCGSSPMMAHIGGPTSSDGRGRLLICPQCAAVWEFERIRCARCGTRHESALHYYHIEGDEAHRIATCDECGGYIRTLFSERDLLPLAYEVEDVVMARLDALAARALEAESPRI